MNDSSGLVRAVGVTTYGGPDALQVAHVPTQKLGPTDALASALYAAAAMTSAVFSLWSKHAGESMDELISSHA